MRNRILGGIGALWGGGVALRFFTMEHGGGSSAYHSGEVAGGFFGLAMFAVGLYYVINGSGTKSPEKGES